MKLLSCHIFSFGKLHDRKFDFSDRLTVIKEGNSFGKTTLANYITGMFYGLPDFRVRDLSNDRRRYDPWQGGIFGGSLTFEYEGKSYHIERDFAKNTFRLSDVATKKEVNKINSKPIDGNNLGDVLFDLNKSSFKRSAYIPQDDIVCGEIEGDLNDKLRNRIHATEDGYSFDKTLTILQRTAETIETKRGKGRLFEVDERIRFLKNKIDECEVCAGNAEQGRARLSAIKGQLAILNEDIEKLDAQIKTQNEADAVAAQQVYYEKLKEDIRQCEDRIKVLTLFFKSQPIETVDIKRIKDTIEAHQKQQKVFQDKENETLAERTRLFSLEEASYARQERKKTYGAQIDGLKEDKTRMLSEKEKAEKEINTLKTAQQNQKGVRFILLCIITFGLYAVFTNRKNKQAAERLDALQKVVSGYETAIADFDNRIASIQQQIEELNNSDNTGNAQKLNALRESLDIEESKVKQFKQGVERELAAFYCMSSSYDQCLYEIEKNLNDIKEAMTTLESLRSELKTFLKDKDETKLAAATEFGLSAERLNQMRNEADQKRLSCMEELLEMDNIVKANEDKADDLSNYESELSDCEDVKERLTAESDILKKTIDFIKEANDSLANQYLMPLLDRSRSLIKLYDEQKADLEFDASSRLLIKEAGCDRELDYFSKGIKELVSICTRIALIDIIFGENPNKPFIILDDPFVNLDDDKLIAAKDFIIKLSKDYQIIYLTCHDSRKITI